MTKAVAVYSQQFFGLFTTVFVYATLFCTSDKCWKPTHITTILAASDAHYERKMFMHKKMILHIGLWIVFMSTTRGLVADSNEEKKILLQKALTPLVFPLGCGAVAYGTSSTLDKPYWDRPSQNAHNSNFQVISYNLETGQGRIWYASMSALTGYCTMAVTQFFGLSRETSASITGSLAALMSYLFLHDCHSYKVSKSADSYNNATYDPANFAMSVGCHALGALAYMRINPNKEEVTKKTDSPTPIATLQLEK